MRFNICSCGACRHCCRLRLPGWPGMLQATLPMRLLAALSFRRSFAGRTQNARLRYRHSRQRLRRHSCHVAADNRIPCANDRRRAGSRSAGHVFSGAVRRRERSARRSSSTLAPPGGGTITDGSQRHDSLAATSVCRQRQRCSTASQRGGVYGLRRRRLRHRRRTSPAASIRLYFSVTADLPISRLNSSALEERLRVAIGCAGPLSFCPKFC